MSVNDSHPGRGLGRNFRSLFRSQSSSTPSPRHRVSLLLRRGRSVFSSQERPVDNSSNMNPDSSHFDPATMVGLSEASQGADNFDIFDWYPRYQNCQRYFLDHAQHSVPVQALSAFLNIRLPFQRQPHPVNSTTTPTPTPTPTAPSAAASATAAADTSATASTSSPSTPLSAPSSTPSVSLIPYLRRLVATGMDFPGVLHGFFGDDWGAGIGPLHEQERRNYLFAAKSGGWAAVKNDYDMPPLETIPFLRPLQGPIDSEIEAAERSWSEWLAMEDWMVGPRAPDLLNDSASSGRPRSSRGG